MSDQPVIWIIESEAFADGQAGLKEAVVASGQRWVEWTGLDEMRDRFSDRPVVFHGSLQAADQVDSAGLWIPGAYCPTAGFMCSNWYPPAAEWLLQAEWTFTTVKELIADPARVLTGIGGPDRFFVRPDSPLKPFSGRVLSREGVTPRALDFGYYYEDESLPIVVAPIRTIEAERRFVVVDRKIVARSGYDARGRVGVLDRTGGAHEEFAASVALRLNPPSDVYVMDVCLADCRFRLLELNPFGGADLYRCDLGAIVSSVSDQARRAHESTRPRRV